MTAGGGKSANTPRRLVMCITGQKTRLEVSSKLQNFVKYNTAKGHIVDVLAILDPSDEARFVNTPEKDTEHHDYLSAFKGHANMVVHHKYVQPEDPETPKWYMDILANGHKFWVDAKDRAQNHVRQFAAMEQCYDRILDMEFKNGHRYDEIFRVRDDSFIMAPVNPLHDVAEMERPDILTPHCDNWLGLNDKAALMLRSVGETYFRGFFKALFLEPIHNSVANPETITFQIIKKAGLKLHQDGLRMMVAPIRGNAKDGCIHLIYHSCWEDTFELANYTLPEEHPWCEADKEHHHYRHQYRYVHWDRLQH
eukprot:CAMPEP_0170187226 /NCGR_PEP_ID=MMETSP0040_2-20121228/41208_1 /TAXON_ID=641309 /ORGANISM="Lotharella oceanica, Strain CCMP622" /LENGTH=308 /DNA_ID=CAMNT_0010434217 /DNA_START=197 /DNA_END=1126 /DNA_ORIENTATION=+